MDTDRETHNTFTDFTGRYEVPQKNGHRKKWKA